MNKLFVITILVCSMVTVSCSKNRGNETVVQETQNQTPEAFNEKVDIASISKRYEPDIIEKLYQEAMEKDKQLKALNAKINEIDDMANDSLQDYRKYVQENRYYYQLVNQYINRLNDTILRNEVKEIFRKSESEYTNRIAKHEASVAQLNTKIQILYDQQILIKLFVTAPMMRNYQNNELPDIKPVKSVLEIYDSLIEESKAHKVFIDL